MVSNLTINSLTLIRTKQLKGGRVINRAIYTIPCKAKLEVAKDGTFTAVANNSYLYAVLRGAVNLTTGDIRLDSDVSKVCELLHPYLKKGFKQIAGYTLSYTATNTARKVK